MLEDCTCEVSNMKNLPMPPIPPEMRHITEQGSFEQRCNWNVVAKDYAQQMKRILRKSGKETRLDMSDAMLKRRIQAIVDYVEDIIERYKDVPGYELERKDNTGTTWIHLNLIPATTYNYIEAHAYLLFAASIWILDEILLSEDPEKRKQLFKILPRDDHAIDELWNCPDFWHASYDYDLVISVMYVLYYRNKDVAPVEMDDDNTERIMINSLHAKNEQHVDVPSRQAFDALMALIPKESIERATAYFEELFWLWTDRYFDCMAPIDEQLRAAMNKTNELIDDYNQLRSELKVAADTMLEQQAKKNQKPAKPTFNPLLANPTKDEQNPFEKIKSGLEMQMRGFPRDPLMDAFSDNTVQQVFRLSERLSVAGDRVSDAMSEFEEVDQKKRVFGMDVLRLGYMRQKDCRESYGEDVAERMKPLRIIKPFEACFALLWLIENGSDLPWLYGCGCGLMEEVVESLPWGVIDYKEYDDLVWNPDLADEFEEDHRTSTAKIKPSTIPEWYERIYVPKEDEMFSFNRSMAQILFEETGCIMPRDIHKYDSRQKDLRKYGVPAKEINTFLLLSTALSHARRSDRAINFDEHIMRMWEEEEQEESTTAEKAETKTKQEKQDKQPPTYEELTEQLKAVQEENKKLRSSLHESERTSRDARKELASVRSNAELDHRELADLRELIFNLDNELLSGEEEKEEVDESLFPYEVKKETVIFGGHETWLKAIRPRLTGNARFMDKDLTFNVNVIRNAEVIWIQPNAMSHSQYYRIVDAARQYKKPVRYFSYASAAKGAMQVLEADQ